MGGRINGRLETSRNNKTPAVTEACYSFAMSGESLEVYRGFYGGVKFMAEQISTALGRHRYQDYSYRDSGNLNSIAIVKDRPSATQADAIIADCVDLISNQKFKPFFYKKLYELGKSTFMERAYKARKYGKNPASYFVHLLK